jgi:hypothetical protein
VLTFLSRDQAAQRGHAVFDDAIGRRHVGVLQPGLLFRLPSSSGTQSSGVNPQSESFPLRCSGQCGSGLTCMTWVPAGYCSRMCSGSADCPKGSSCVDVGSQRKYCLLDENGGCTRADVRCIDCGAKVCGASSFCDGC